MSLPFPSPTDPRSSRAEVFLGYLDYFRSVMVSKLQGLGDDELRASRLPSGWTPLELLKHLTYVELRWLVWGFEGEPVAQPWGDCRDERWYVAGDPPAATHGRLQLVQMAESSSCSPSVLAPTCQEDQLTTWPVGGLTHLVDFVPGGDE